MATKSKAKSKIRIYREIIAALEKEFMGGNYEDWSCGNTMGLYVGDPWRCQRLFEKFHKTKAQTKK